MKPHEPMGPEARHSILLVEDEPRLREVVGDVLAGEGYSVVPVSGREEALREFQPGRFRVALVDLNLPDDPGEDLWRLLRALDPNVFLIISSGDSVRLRNLAADAGQGIPTLRKPYSIAQLLREIERGIQWQAGRGQASPAAGA